MFRRYLLAGLAMLTFSLAAMADVHRDGEHRVEAVFPTEVNRFTKSLPNDAKVFMAQSKDKHFGFSLGVVEQAGVEMRPEQLETFSKGFIQGVMNSRKNSTITRQGDMALNDNSPKGKSHVIKHDQGSLFAWTSIENGKAYFVIIEGSGEESFKSATVKNFLNSVKITAMK
jgi:hypothetical protein